MRAAAVAALPQLNPRQQSLAAWLAHEGTASVLDLAEQFRVSDETIRRDLKVLADLQQVERFHGGVRFIGLDQEAPFAQRLRTQAQAKAELAAVAAAQIPDGASLVLDNSSTACFLARALAARKGLTVMTPSIEVAGLLARPGSGHRVLLPPGELRASDRTLVGVGALDALRRFLPDYFVFSVAAVGPDHACLDFDLFEMEFKQAMLAGTCRALLLLDAGKYAAHAPMRVCGPERIDLLVTDRAPPPWAGKAMAGARVCVAGASSSVS